MIHADQLADLAEAAVAESRPWQEQVEELGVCADAVERQGSCAAQQFAAMSIDFHRAVAAAYASGFHLGLLAAQAGRSG